MNLCISPQQFDQFRTLITIIPSSDARSTLQRHPESKQHLLLGGNPKNLESFSKPQSKGRERLTDNLRDKLKYSPKMTKTKLRDLDGPLSHPSRDRYADDIRNEHASGETRSRTADLEKENMRVLDASLEEDDKETMRIDEELRRSSDEVLRKSLQIKSNLERQTSTIKKLLAVREQRNMGFDNLHSDLVRYRLQLDTTQKNLEKFRVLKSTIAP
ncbi:uncharacterized protein EAE97_004370 [Botrytis byssoidea]|uniref:Uncharacterized protein n=1 Tax=Botrytis byssoidea TaxID=139641 RepID=A0A9P5IMJ0_9HELO|nr:uncharacterized protein EAE97_004370 [Botrytis byssoidea]KAF7947121.1 hypothetical protein EAE97_004370 [Botrytis byssoidea]